MSVFLCVYVRCVCACQHVGITVFINDSVSFVLYSCVCVCQNVGITSDTHTHIFIIDSVSFALYLCVCVCVMCVPAC